MHRVVFLCADMLQLIDLAGPMDVFDAANRLRRDGPFYELLVVSPQGGSLDASNGLKIETMSSSDVVGPIDSLIVVGAFMQAEQMLSSEYSEVCASLGARAERLVSICNGAFGLAAAGLLDERTVTTHWSQGDELAALCPTTNVDPGRIFVQDGNLFTSGGATSGIDLALALVAQDLGVDIARQAAKWLVVFLTRPGGQSQFSATARPPAATSIPVEQALERIHDNSAADHRVGTLAAQVGLSRRHLARVFKAETGSTVASYVETVRLERATILLESTDLDHETIAKQIGFASGEVMRQVFRRERGISPSQQREHFAAVRSG